LKAKEFWQSFLHAAGKRICRENIKELCWKPLIAWTIEQGLSCSIIGKIVVSTDV